MSKTTTANFNTEKNKTANSNTLIHLLEIDSSGGTVYYSDQAVTVSGQAYTANVLNWGVIENQLDTSEDSLRVGEVNMQLSNSPRIDGTIDAGNIIRIYVWYSNLVLADKLKIFEGVISEDIEWTDLTISFSAEDNSEFFNKLIWDPLQTDSFAGLAPDPDDVGKQMPIIYGDVKNHTCLAIDAGAATTLRGDINSSVTTIPVASTTSPIAFPSSGTILIGDEEITYSGKTSTTFTGATRGTGGTDAVSHSNGDSVLNNVATVKYLVANHPVKAITNPRILPFGEKLVSAVDVSSSATTAINDDGVGTIVLDDLPTIRKSVNVAVTQQPSVSLQQKFSGSAIHNHDITGPSEVTLYGDAAPVGQQQNVANSGNAYDQNFDTTEATLTYTSPSSAYLGLEFDYSGFDGLVINQAGACIRVSVVVSSTLSKLRLPGSTFGLLNQDLNIGGGVATQKFIVSGLANETDWTKLDTLRIVVSGPGGPLTTRVYQMWWEIKYEPAVSNETISDGTIATTGGTEVVVGGDSVADSLGGVLICDVEGWQDESTAHYTDSGNALIEESWDVIHHVLENYSRSGVKSESLNETDFATHAKWDDTGDMDSTGGNATYTHSGGAGTLTQTSGNMAIAGVADKPYRFTYKITTSGGLGDVAGTITTGFASSARNINITIGTHTIYLKSGPSPGDFVLSLTSTSGDCTFDDVSLKEDSGITEDMIDLSGSFQDAEDNLPASYTFAFAMNTKRSLNRLFALLAMQCFCRAVVEAGLYKLIRIKTSGTSIKALDTNNDSLLKNNRLQVTVRKRGLSEIANDVEIKYNINQTIGGWDSPEAYEGSSISTDSTSIQTYGNQQRSWLMWAIGDNSTMADDIAGKLNTLLKDPRKEITFPTFLMHIELERGDVIDITISQLGFSSSDAEIINTTYIPFSGGRDPEMRLTSLVL